MANLNQITNRIIKNLNIKVQVRERAISLSREINRGANEIVHNIHNNKNVSIKMKALKNRVKKLNALLKDQPGFKYSGLTTNAVQEYAEAFIFYSIIEKEPVPTPKELEIDDIPYTLGLADVVGELRRLTLKMIIEKDLKSAKRYFQHMENISEILSKFNYPDSMIPIRRKQDIARGILEKTQGELAVAISTTSLETKMKN